MGIRDHQRDMGVSMSVDTCAGCNSLSSAQTPIQCRSALEWILTPVDGERAGVWAEKLIDTFGSLSNTLAADIDIITEMLDGLPAAAIHLHRLHSVITHSAQCQLQGDSVFSRWEQLIEYLKLEMGKLRIEQIRGLFLDSRHSLIGNEILATGTNNEVQCYPSQIARRAVILYATGAILVHNHPSGDVRMSREDKSMTYAVEQACKAVGVRLHDHLVISRNNYSSFRQDNPLWQR